MLNGGIEQLVQNLFVPMETRMEKSFIVYSQ